MEFSWVLFLGSVFNFLVLIALIAFIISAIRKPTPFKKKVLTVLIVILILVAIVRNIGGEAKFFSDDDMSYQAIVVGQTTEDKLFELFPAEEDDITVIEEENLTAVSYDGFMVYLRGNTVWQIDITGEGALERIFNIKVGDTLDTVKIKLPAELKEENVYGAYNQDQFKTKDSGYLVHFYNDDQYVGSCVIIFSASGNRYMLLDLDGDNKVSLIRYNILQ